MKKEELEELVKNLESELSASMRREELLLDPSGGESSLRRKLKRTRLGRAVLNPNSKLGKIARAPRTAFRLLRNPRLIGEIKNEKKCDVRDGEEIAKDELFVPIKFFKAKGGERRVNLVLERLDPVLLGIAISVANSNKMELRIVTYSEKADPIKYNDMIKKNKLSKAERVSFYSSVDQKYKNKVFELEINEDDVFITKAWGTDGE